MSTHSMSLWRTVENYPLIITKYPPYLFHCFESLVKTKSCLTDSIEILGMETHRSELILNSSDSAQKEQSVTFH